MAKKNPRHSNFKLEKSQHHKSERQAGKASKRTQAGFKKDSVAQALSFFVNKC